MLRVRIQRRSTKLLSRSSGSLWLKTDRDPLSTQDASLAMTGGAEVKSN